MINQSVGMVMDCLSDSSIEKLKQLSIADMAATTDVSLPNGVESSRKRWYVGKLPFG